MLMRIVETPTLANLSLVLRNHELWPDGHRWEFSSRYCCAAGIAHELWGTPLTFEGVQASFGLSRWQTYRIFAAGNLLHLLHLRTITPEIVAGRIDRYLRRT